MRRIALAFAAATLLAAGGARADDVKTNLALAQRYLAATGGSRELFEEQIYAAAGAIGDSATSHARQNALQASLEQQRDALSGLDGKLAALMAIHYTHDELAAAVAFTESPTGREIARKRADFYAAPFVRGRIAPDYSAAEAAAMTGYGRSPDGASFEAKAPALLDAAGPWLKPLQTAVRDGAATIYCHQTRNCRDIDHSFDTVAGPMIRGQ